VIVLDASAVLELLLGGERARPVEERLEGLEGPWQAPAHLDLEVAQVLRRWEAAGFLCPARARAGLELLAALPLFRHPLTPLLPRVWTRRPNLTAYDAAYLWLAADLRAPLVTFDVDLGAAARRFLGTE